MYLYEIKQFYILYRICQSQDSDFVTSIDLSEELNITSKTVKAMISGMNEYTADNGFSIVSKKGSGYSITVNNHRTFEDFRNRLYSYFNKYNSSLLQHDTRVMYMLMYLLQASKTPSINQLMDIFYVSNSTIYNDINKAKKTISSLSVIQGNRVLIDEKEFSKRNKICLLYNHLLYSEGIEMLFDDPFYKEYELRLKQPEIHYHVISKAIKKYGISISAEAISLIYFYCLLSEARYRLKKYLSLTYDIDRLSELAEYKCAEQILSGYHLSNCKDKEEIAAIAVLLLVYNGNHFNAKDRYASYSEELDRFVESLSRQLNDCFSNSLESLTSHKMILYQIFARLFFALYFEVNDFSFDNLTYRTENTDNQVIIELSRYIAEFILLKTGRKLSHSLIHMLSFSLRAYFIAVEEDQYKLKLLIVPKESEIYWPFIMRKIENSLPHKPDIYFVNEYELPDVDTNSYDMIITNYRSLSGIDDSKITFIDFNADVNISLVEKYYYVYNRKNYNYREFIKSFDNTFIHNNYSFDSVDSFFDDLMNEVGEYIRISKDYLVDKNNLLNYYTKDGIVIIPNISNNLNTPSILSLYNLLDTTSGSLWRERKINTIIFINYDINNDIQKMKKLVNLVDYMLKTPDWHRHLNR